MEILPSRLWLCTRGRKEGWKEGEIERIIGLWSMLTGALASNQSREHKANLYASWNLLWFNINLPLGISHSAPNGSLYVFTSLWFQIGWCALMYCLSVPVIFCPWLAVSISQDGINIRGQPFHSIPLCSRWKRDSDFPRLLSLIHNSYSGIHSWEKVEKERKGNWDLLADARGRKTERNKKLEPLFLFLLM